MDFIALKPCCFAGQKFKIGETVPGELVLPEMKKRLLSMGKLAVAPAEEHSESFDSEEHSESPKKPQKNKKQTVMKDAELDV